MEGLEFNTEYRARVKAVNRIGCSTHSAVLRIHTAQGTSTIATTTLNLLITSTEEGGYVFGSVCLSVCMFVCLSVCLPVRRITRKLVNGF